jgi:hypothetical protein
MFDSEFIAISGIGLLALITLVLHFVLYFRLKKLFSRGKNESIDDVLVAYKGAIEDTYENIDEIKKVLENHESRLRQKVTTPKTVRFNAWGDMSGTQSFATRITDEEGNGVVVSTLYAREKTSIFAKPVNKWSTEQELTDEEKKILNER